MANRSFKRDAATLEAATIKLWGKVTTTTSGTIDSTSCKGFTVVKTANEAGRYTVTLADKYAEFKTCSVIVEGAADAAYTSSKGLIPMLRNVNMSTRTFDVQFCDPADSADEELADGAIFYLEITIKNTAAVY